MMMYWGEVHVKPKRKPTAEKEKLSWQRRKERRPRPRREGAAHGAREVNVKHTVQIEPSANIS